MKVGGQLFTSEGPSVIRRLARMKFDIFLDLKFHDIPNTVACSVRAAAELPNVRMVNMHTLGGFEMMSAARKALSGVKNPPLLLGVTLLTSHDAATLREIGVSGSPSSRVLHLAQLAKSAGMDGVVASAHEARAIRASCGPKFRIVVPGIRPAGSAKNDQSRIATPGNAIRAGADFVVIGRALTAAADPRAVSVQIADEVAAALNTGAGAAAELDAEEAELAVRA
jgi:orotidine-5'-phosphate decarboxylase